MGISEQLGGIYSALEGKFYSAMDFLSDKGIPVYAAIDPFEDRGIPFLPIAIALLILLAFLGYGFLFLAKSEATMTLSLTDNEGSSLSGVSILAKGKDGKDIDLKSTTFRDGQVVNAPVGIGSQIMLEASKDGYEDALANVYFKTAEANVEIVLKRVRTQIAAEIRLADDDTGDAVAGAKVTARLSDTSMIECGEKAGEAGTYVCAGVYEGEKIQLSVDHPNYEQKKMDSALKKDPPAEIGLIAKAALLMGKANLLVRAFDSDTKQRLGNFRLKVYDAKSGDLIIDTSETDNDGEQVVKIQRGTSARIVVEKGEYIAYDSSDVGENQTLLSDEVKKEVYLRKGSNVLTVSVIDAAGKPLPGVPVTLFNSSGGAIGTKETNLAGEAGFDGLDPKQTYYAGAWQETALPVTQKADLSKSNDVRLTMLKGTASNSGNLTVYTADEKSKPIPDVSLRFFLEDANGLAPLGLPVQKTDASGKFSLLGPLNAAVVVKAVKGSLEGEQKANIIDTFKNEVYITMREPGQIVKVTVLDKDEKEVESGFISIVGGNDILYEGPYYKGLTFNPKSNKYATVSFSDDSGNSFEEEAYVQDRNEIIVSPKGKKSVGTSPEAEFLGVYSVDGKKLDGLLKGVDVYLKFRVAYSAGTTKNGLHVRLGEDNIGFADSQDAGITGFSAVGGSSFYGRSYSPQPSPGFEALDFENSGQEGKFNKWLELYFQSAGEKMVKVRARAKENSEAAETEVHYRAWSTIGGATYRTPSDHELNLSQFSSTKTALYAQTNIDKARIMDAASQCKNDFCASYKFLAKTGSQYAPENFKASLGESYSFEITLAPGPERLVTVKASTQKQSPKIGFQGFDIDSAAAFPDLNSEDTSLQIDNIPVRQQGQSAKVNVYFKALRAENSSITLQLISGEKVLNEQFYFEVFKEKAISMKTIPETVAFGEDFVIQLKADDATQIDNAQIRLSASNGSHLATIIGNNTANKGAGGRYLVKNNFSAGTIKYEIRTNGYKPLDGTIEVTKKGGLKFSEEKAYVIIPRGQKSSERLVELSNLTKQSMMSVDFEVKPVGQLPDGMAIKVGQLSNMAPNSTQKISIIAEYNGERESSHADARVIARGRTDSGYTVTAEILVTADYNPKIPADCVEFSKEKLVIMLASGSDERGYYNSTYASRQPSYSGSGAYANSTYSGAGVQGIDGTGGSSGSAGDSGYRTRYNNDYTYSPSGATGNGYYGSNYYTGSQYGGRYGTGYPSNYYRYNGYSTSTQDIFTAKLANRPECQVGLEMKPEVLPRSSNSQGIDLESTGVRLSPQANGQQVSATALGSARRSDTQEVVVTATNSIPRNFPTKESFGFDIIYRAEGFEKNIPVDIIIWNPMYALEVVHNIELYLGPDDKGQLAAQVPLFVRNVGEADIENVEFRVSSATTRGNVDLKVTPSFPVQFLRRGDTIFPPPTIIAQALRNERTTLSETKELDVTGVINGQTFSFGPVYVTAHISASQCLTITPSNVSFYKQKAEGSKSAEITLRNTCAEEVRVLEISRPAIGRNIIYLAPMGMILPPHSETRANLVIDIYDAYQGSPVPLYVKSLLVRSGRPIDSNPVYIDLKLGPAALKGGGATEPVTMKVCGDEKQTKQVKFPVMASSSSPMCDTAYCDAVQLSNYVATRIDESIKDAERGIQQRSAEIQKADCSKLDLARGYCTFDGLGVKTKTYYVYMSHDNIYTSLLQKALERTQGPAKNYRVDYLAGNDPGEYLGGYSKQVFLNGLFRGCGLYAIRLNGVVRVEGSRILPDQMNILVDFSPEEGQSARTMTEQCTSKIQNFNNFLPRDEGLNPNQKIDTWLGVVRPNSKGLEEVSVDVAKTLFGSDKRAVDGDVGTNALALELGSDQSYIVRIEMPKGESENHVTLKAIIRESLVKGKNDSEKLQLQKDIAREAGQAIKNMRDNEMGKETCISADETYMQLRGIPSSAKFGIEVPKESLAVRFEERSCIGFTVTSDIKETIAISSSKSIPFDGFKAGSPFITLGNKGDMPQTQAATIAPEDRSPATGQGTASSPQTNPNSGAPTPTNQTNDKTTTGPNQPTTTGTGTTTSTGAVIVSQGNTGLAGLPSGSAGTTQTTPQDTSAGMANATQVNTLETSDFDEKTGRFVGYGKVCVEGSSQLQQVQGKTIAITAKRIGDPNSQKKDTKEIPLAVCGIHPIKFLEKTRDLKFGDTKNNEYYYATFVWKGPPDERTPLPLDYLLKMGEVLDTVDHATQIIKGEREVQKTDSEEVKSAKKTAGWSFFGACAGTSVVTGLLRPIIGWNPATLLLNVLADCGIPFVALMGDAYVWTEMLNNIGKAIIDNVVGFLKWPFVKWLGLGDAAENAQATVKEISATGAAGTIYKAFALEAAIKDSIQTYLRLEDTKKFEDSATRYKGFSKARVVAENVANDLVEKIKKEAFGGATFAAGSPESAFLDDFKTKFLNNVDEAVKEAGVGAHPLRGGVITEEELKKVIQSAAEKTGGDPDVLMKFAKARAGINTLTPNGFVDKETISKGIISEVDKVTLYTDDVPGKSTVDKMTLDVEKDALQTWARNDLKDNIIREYARNMGITDAEARGIIGSRLDSSLGRIKAVDEIGQPKATINLTEMAAIQDTVTKQASSDVTDGLTENLSKRLNITSDETRKLIGEELGSIQDKVTRNVTNFNSIDPNEIRLPTAMEWRNGTADLLASQKGMSVADIETLFGSRLDAVVTKSSGQSLVTARQMFIEEFSKLTGISIDDAARAMDLKLNQAAQTSLESVLGKKWGNIRGSLDQLSNEKEAISQKIASKYNITLDDARKIVGEQLEEAARTADRKVASTLSEQITTDIGKRATTITNTTEYYYKVKVPKSAQDAALNEAKRELGIITKEAIDNPGRHPALDKAIEKAFQKKGMPQLVDATKSKVDLKKGLPGFFSGKGQLLFWKNLLKEGAFGALANYVGFVAYDTVLDSQMKKLKKDPNLQSRAKELADAGLGDLGTIFETEPGTAKEILKYRTYRVSVSTRADGLKAVRLKLVSEIPANTKKSYLLDDCTNPGFDQGMGASMPRLIPKVEPDDKLPKAFLKTSEMKTKHRLIARNYLVEQDNGERYGALISAAVADLAPIFKAQTGGASGLELEPLVVSIGIVKSQLGIEEAEQKKPVPAMFGCSLGTIPLNDPYNNARCAAEKLLKYAPKCQAKSYKPSCFLEEYSNDPAKPVNQKANAIPLTNEEFDGLYATWKGYAWQAS